MIWVAICVLLAYINAAVARSRGYFFWRTFLFSLLLGAVVLTILYTNGVQLF